MNLPHFKVAYSVCESYDLKSLQVGKLRERGRCDIDPYVQGKSMGSVWFPNCFKFHDGYCELRL